MQSFSCTSHSECAPSDYPLTSTCVRSVTDTHPFYVRELCSLNAMCRQTKIAPHLSTVLPRAGFPLAPDQSRSTACKTCLWCVCASAATFSSVIYSCRLRHPSQIATQFSSKLMAVWRTIHVLSSEKLSQHVRSKDLMYPAHNKTYLQDSYFNTNMPYIETHYRELNLEATMLSRENSSFL